MKILMILIICLLFPLSAFAGPYLVCDSQVNVTKYEIDLDGTVYSPVPEDLGDDMVRVKFDLEGIVVGSHDLQVRAGNMWGWSDWTPPFSFAKELPLLPTGLSLEE